MERKRTLNLGKLRHQKCKSDFPIARSSGSAEPDCHSALLSKTGQFSNQPRNQTAKKAARTAARKLPLFGALIPHLDLSEFKPHYIEWDEAQAHERGCFNTDPNSIWEINSHGMILFPEDLVPPILQHIYEGTYYRRDALVYLIFEGPSFTKNHWGDYASLSYMHQKQS